MLHRSVQAGPQLAFVPPGGRLRAVAKACKIR
jgi:hypothetical protein